VETTSAPVDRFGGIADQGDAAAAELGLAGAAALDDDRIGIEALGTGQRQLEPQQPGGVEPGVGHVVAVADPGVADLADVAAQLVDGEQVGHQLARVQLIGEAVEHRHRGPAGQLLGPGLIEGADDDAVAVTAQHPRGVLDRLAAGDLGALRRQVDRVAAELEHADLERHPGAGGGLLEDHAEGASGQGADPMAAGPRRLELGRPREQIEQLAGGEIVERQEVALASGHQLRPEDLLEDVDGLSMLLAW
jgi:hypothetical protein